VAAGWRHMGVLGRFTRRVALALRGSFARGLSARGDHLASLLVVERYSPFRRVFVARCAWLVCSERGLRTLRKHQRNSWASQGARRVSEVGVNQALGACSYVVSHLQKSIDGVGPKKPASQTYLGKTKAGAR